MHLLVADSALCHWRVAPDRAPFDTHDADCVNAFRHGCLAPDFGLFPGGDAGFSAITHHGSTGALLRAMLQAARTPAQRAFACGWLTHTLADVAIHPLVNTAAGNGGAWSLADHVRVEVGLDVRFCWQHERLRGLRLTPAFTRAGYGFVADAMSSTHSYRVPPAHLVRMQRGMIVFTHAALFFATSLARDVCWEDAGRAALEHPRSVMLWRALSSACSRTSLVHAYLNPVQPAALLIRQVESALQQLVPLADAHIATGLRDLPDYDLETGASPAGDSRTAA
jgi:hypothetical protein